jgi:hypothetical protein
VTTVSGAASSAAVLVTTRVVVDNGADPVSAQVKSGRPVTVSKLAAAAASRSIGNKEIGGKRDRYLCPKNNQLHGVVGYATGKLRNAH